MSANNANPPYAGAFLDLASYGNTDGILSPAGSGGYAWGTYAHGSSDAFITVARNFATGPSGSASLYDQTFSIGIASAGIGGNGSPVLPGASIVSLNIGTFVLFYIGGGPDNMALSVNGGVSAPLPVTFAELEAGLQVFLSVTGPPDGTADQYQLTISPFAGGPAYPTTSGTFDNSGGATDFFMFSDYYTTQNAYFNNPSISPEGVVVPEPSGLVMLGMSGLIGLLFVRKRALV